MKDQKASIEKLKWIMSQLRNPDGGCPWDIKQTFSTIVPYTLEEAYEVAEAIEKKDFDELEKELGDLLFQVIFYSQLADEEKLFDFDDVVSAICEKLIRRHPHVFADNQFNSDEEIKANWENEKAKERQNKSANTQLSVLADIPAALPALSQANKIQKRCAHVGFDWDNMGDVFAKVKEEVEEIQQELEREKLEKEKLSEEIGDLLFATVNLARHAKLDPEQVLRQANQKFRNRFEFVETSLISTGRSVNEASLEEMETLWQEAKRKR